MYVFHLCFCLVDLAEHGVVGAGTVAHPSAQVQVEQLSLLLCSGV